MMDIYNIYVRTLTGHKFIIVGVKDSDTCSDFKKKIFEQEGYEIAWQHIYPGGKEWIDTQTYLELKTVIPSAADGTLNLVLRPPTKSLIGGHQDEKAPDENLAPNSTSSSIKAQFVGLKTQANLKSSSLSPEEIKQIQKQIEKLNAEIKSCWPYPNKDRKLVKAMGLEALLTYSTRMTADQVRMLL